MPKPRLILAPLQGVTTWIFRETLDSYFGGFDSAYSPFLSTVRESTIKESLLKDILPERNRGRMRLIPQILSNDPEGFVTLSRAIADLGYNEVNWNLGCPSGTVTKKRRGCALLPHHGEIEAFLSHIFPRLPIKLSIKIRLGFKSPEELDILIPIFNQFPLTELAIHARTGDQMYEGKVNLPAFGKALEASTNPVVYNGDLRTTVDFENLRKRFPAVDGWMIGRGAIADPYLAGSITSEERPEKNSEKIHEFHNELFARYQEVLFGPVSILGKMKELWFYLSQSFTDGRDLLKKVRKATHLERYQSVVKEFFAGAPTISQLPSSAYFKRDS